jgi:predicted ArsR family transcriptional regulator
MPRDGDDLSPARRRVAETLKTSGASTAAQLALSLDLTQVAVRQHLQGLERLGLVAASSQPPDGRGRPSRLWRLTSDAMALFPDRHGELTVGLIEAIRSSVGEQALDKIVDARGEAQKRKYAELMPKPTASLRARVAALAAQRTREGYMAEVQREAPGCYLLIEHHCPICVAAASCVGLCRIELEVFRAALGPTTDVERVEHLLDGDERCVYRVRGRTTAKKRGA